MLIFCQINDAQRRRRELQKKNEQLAQQSYDLQPKFEESKEELRRKCIEAADLKEEYTRRYGELSESSFLCGCGIVFDFLWCSHCAETISSRSDSSAILKDLQKAGKDSEQSAEVCYNNLNLFL